MLALKKILKKTKKKLKTLDNERLAIALVSLLGLGLLITLLIFEPGLLESEWFLNLLNISEEYGSFIAGGAYLGRLVNLFTARSFTTNNKEQKTKVTTLFNKEIIMGRQILGLERQLTPVGMLLGVLIAVICILLHITVPFFNIFSYFAYILFLLGYACTLGGLFNRLGSSLDGTRLPQEKKAILFGAISGFIFALSLMVVLALTGTLPLIAMAGISKVFFDLFVLHKTLFIVTFIFSITSLSTSFFDYFVKAICFLKYKYQIGGTDNAINERLKSRYHEYRGAFFGLPISCVLSIGIVTSLILSGGLVTAPFAVITTMIIIFITCNSVISALFSRIGRVIDGIQRVSSSDETSNNQNTPASVQNEHSTARVCHLNSVGLRNSHDDELDENNLPYQPALTNLRNTNTDVFIKQQNPQSVSVSNKDDPTPLPKANCSYRVLIDKEKKLFTTSEPKDSLNPMKYKPHNTSFFQPKRELDKSNECNGSKFKLA